MWKRGQRPPYSTAPLMDRIENKLRIDGDDPIESCWIWLGAYSTKTGRPGSADRPVIQLAGRGSPVVNVLRVLLSMLDGVPLKKRRGVKACHKCDDAQCVNPHHGYWGTDADNTADRMLRQPQTFWSHAYRRRLRRLNLAERAS